MGAYEVLDELARSHKAARPPTVYRALDFLMAEGLIHKIEIAERLSWLHRGPAAPHSGQFLICRKCGATEEIVDPRLETALEAAAARVHFRPERKVVEISGLCARCGK